MAGLVATASPVQAAESGMPTRSPRTPTTGTAYRDGVRGRVLDGGVGRIGGTCECGDARPVGDPLPEVRPIVAVRIAKTEHQRGISHPRARARSVSQRSAPCASSARRPFGKVTMPA